MDGFLSKPVSPDELRAAIDRLAPITHTHTPREPIPQPT